MASNTLTITGNLAADPELKYLPNGRAVVKVRLGNTPRQLNRQTNEWEDGTTTWITAEAWGGFAENIAQSLRKGNAVIASGTIKSDEYTTQTGEKRTSMKLALDEIGPALSRHVVNGVERSTNRANNGGDANAAAARNYQAAQRPAVQPAADEETPF